VAPVAQSGSRVNSFVPLLMRRRYAPMAIMVLFEFDPKSGAIIRERPTGARFGAPAPASRRVSPLQTVQPPANGITWPWKKSLSGPAKNSTV
jgi:hypothetical protein